MIELGKIKINVYENNDGEIVFTKKEMDELREETHDLNYELIKYRLENSVLRLTNMELENQIKELDKEIEELKKKLADIELKNNQKDMRLIDAVIDAIYETDIDFYNKLVRNVEFGEEEIIVENR